MISDSEILLSFGNYHTVDVKQLDLSDSLFTSSTLMSSSFYEHSATLANKISNQRMAFVSSRSGKYRIWLKENNQLQQLTFFKAKTYLSKLSFSANGEKLLFDMNARLYVLDIKTKHISEISAPTEQVKNFLWQCHSDNNILLNVLEKGSWLLYQHNIDNQKNTLLAEGVTSIHGDCGNIAGAENKLANTTKNSRYYASHITNLGLYRLTENWQIDEAEHYFSDVLFDDNRQWGVTADALYRITLKKELYKLELTSRQQTQIDLGDINAYYLTVADNKLLLNDLQFADTYIGKITIPGLAEKLAQH